MKDNINIYLLDCYLDSYNLFTYVVNRLNSLYNITVYLPSPLYFELGISAFTSRHFIGIINKEIKSNDGIELEILNHNSIAIYKDYKKWNKQLSICGISVDSVSNETYDINKHITRTFSDINELIANREIERVLRRENVSDTFNNDVSVVSVDNNLTTEIPKCVLIFASEIASAVSGTGMGNQRVDTINNMYTQCKLKGYDLYIYNEDDIFNLNLNSNDIVHGITVGGLYSGGYTSRGFGFNINNLIILSKKTLSLKSKPIITASLHASENSLLKRPTKNQISAMSNCIYSAYTVSGLEFIKELGLPCTPNTFPIMTSAINNIHNPNTKNRKIKNILLQIDTQSRKNGEYALLATIDAFNLAKKKNKDLEINIICKSSAAYHYTSESYLERLIKSVGLKYPNPVNGLTLQFQGYVDDNTWKRTLNTTDIAIFMSIEEGIHLFVNEIWRRGAHCVLANTKSYTMYSLLEDSTTFIDCIEVPYGGAGKHNDMFNSDILFFNYNDAVIKIADVILTKHNNGIQHSDTNLIDEDGSLTINQLGIIIDHNRSTINTMFSRNELRQGIKSEI